MASRSGPWLGPIPFLPPCGLYYHRGVSTTGWYWSGRRSWLLWFVLVYSRTFFRWSFSHWYRGSLVGPITPFLMSLVSIFFVSFSSMTWLMAGSSQWDLTSSSWLMIWSSPGNCGFELFHGKFNMGFSYSAPSHSARKVSLDNCSVHELTHLFMSNGSLDNVSVSVLAFLGWHLTSKWKSVSSPSYQWPIAFSLTILIQ